MEKLEQVFVSSTYLDLKDERQAVIQTLLEANCLPAGMELFPASDDLRWTLIERVIRGCDYYIVIVGGRYGSLDESTGLSYTEREFDAAVSIGIPVMGFLHGSPGDIKADHTELDPGPRQKLAAFRNKVEARMCKHWTTAEGLGAQVAKSLIQIRRTHPAVGWVRATEILTPETREEIAGLRLRIAELERLLDEASETTTTPDPTLVQGPDLLTLQVMVMHSSTQYDFDSDTEVATVVTTWDRVFAAVAPVMLDEASESTLRQKVSGFVAPVALKQAASALKGRHVQRVDVIGEGFDQVKVQLFALGLIERSDRKRGVNDQDTYWTLTRTGESHLLQLRALRREASSG